MRNSTKVLGAFAVAGLVAAGGSAFTATSTIDAANKTIGATAQSISGVSVTDVSYTTDAATDATSAVAFHVAQVLGSNDVLTVKLNNTAGICTPTAAVDPATGTDVACSWGTPVAGVTSLSIVVS